MVILGNIIRIIHILFLVFVIIVPFIDVELDIRVLYFWALLSTIVHWIANDTTCFLTILEKKLTGKTDNESFIYSLVSPVYDLSKSISDKQFRTYMQYLAFIFFIINIYRIKKQIGEKNIFKALIQYEYFEILFNYFKK